jgi:hypothetical protein
MRLRWSGMILSLALVLLAAPVRAHPLAQSNPGEAWSECNTGYGFDSCTTFAISPLGSNPFIKYRVISGYFSGCSWRVRDIYTQAIVNSGSIPRITSTIGTVSGLDPAHKYRLELFWCDNGSLGRIQNYQ